MWWLDAESPSGNAAGQLQASDQASQDAAAVQQLQSELEARDTHIAAQCEHIGRLQRELKEQAAGFARQHELAHQSRRAAVSKLGKTQSKLIAVMDRSQAERVEHARTRQEHEQRRSQQLATAQIQQREMQARLAQLVDVHAIAQAELNAKLGSLERVLSEQQRAAHEQSKQHAAQLAELEVQHAKRLASQLEAAQATRLRAQKTELQHVAQVKQLTEELSGRNEQLAAQESLLAEVRHLKRVAEEELAAQAASLKLQREQLRNAEAALVEQTQRSKQEHDDQVGQLQADIAQLQSSIDEKCAQDAAQRLALADLKSQHGLQLAAQQRLLDASWASEKALTQQLSDRKAKHELESEQSLKQIVSLQSLLAQRAAVIDALRKTEVESAAQLEHSQNRNAKLQSVLVDRECGAEDLRATLAQRNADLEQSQDNNVSLQALLAQRETEIATLRETQIQSAAELELSKNHNTEQQAVLSARDTELEALRQAIAEHISQREQAECIKSQLQTTVGEQHSEITTLLATIGKQETKLGDQALAQQRLLDAARVSEAALRDELALNNARYAAKCDEFQEATDLLRSTLAARETEVRDHEELLEASESALAELHSAHRQCIQRASEAQQSLQTQMSDCKALHATQLSKERATNAELQAANSEPQATSSDLQATSSDLQATVSELQAKNLELQATVAERSLAIGELQEQLESDANAHAELVAQHAKDMADADRNLQASVQQSSIQENAALTERELVEHRHAAELERQLTNQTRLSRELDQALQENCELEKRLRQRAAAFERGVREGHQRERLLLAEIAVLRQSVAEQRQERLHVAGRLDAALASLESATESEGALREQLGALSRNNAELKVRFDETLQAHRSAVEAHGEACNSLRGECEEMAGKLQQKGKAFSEALAALVETRSRLSAEQSLRRQAEADMAEYSRYAEQSRNYATTWLDRLQKESAARRKAESALRRAADTADQATVAHVARVALDARQRCERLAAELVATRAFASKAQRRLTAEFKRAQEEIDRLRSKLDLPQAAAHTIPISEQAAASSTQSAQWPAPQSKVS